MHSVKSLVIVFFALCLVAVIALNSLASDHIRMPIWSGKFYPSNRAELEQMIASLTQKATRTTVNIPPHKQLKAIILPHAGYIYSGFTAAHASLVLGNNQFNKVILLGPDHRIGYRNCAISQVKGYQTPLGLIGLHPDTRRLLNKTNLFQSILKNHEIEHSLEVILPFLQYYLKEFKLVPIVMGHPTEIRGIADTIEPLLDADTLLVVSSDLSHFLPYSKASARDKETIDLILNNKAKKLKNRENCACGKVPILLLMEIAHRRQWQPVLLHYSNSGDTAGDRSKVVGYSAIAYFGDTSLSQKQGQVLVKLARKTIMEQLGQKMSADQSRQLADALKDRFFTKRCGTFVTLKIDGRLRGCIGSLTAKESIQSGIIHNALNAAFADPRFPPLTSDEFDHIDIEISVLTQPKPLEYTDYSDLLAKLRVNIDGVIIRKGRAVATFLPQVWRQLPEPEIFLSRLCSKAGLSANSWKNTKLEVLTYQAQYFGLAEK